MSTVSKKVLINAPVTKVFAFVINPENWTKYVTSLVEVKNVSSPNAEKGTTFNWTYRMLGMNFHGRGQVTENTKNKKFGLKMDGSFPITESYSFTSVENGTELSIEVEYEMPGKVMSVLTNKGLMEKINKKESDNVLSKIKLFCESL